VWPFVRVASSLALLGGRLPHGDLLVRAPRPQIGDVRLADPLNANVRGLATRCRVGPADDLSLAGLVGEAVADLKLHWEDAACGWRFALLLGA
jgi:hypothetical protein